MAVNPIEMISMAPKSWETSNQNVARLQKQEVMNQHLAAEYGKDVEHESQQTVKTAKTDQQEYRYDANSRGGSKGAYQEGQNKRKKDEEKKEDTGKISGSKLDILI